MRDPVRKKNESKSRCAFGESAINGDPIGRHQPPSLAVMRSRCTEYNDSMATPMRRILQIEEREKKEVKDQTCEPTTELWEVHQHVYVAVDI